MLKRVRPVMGRFTRSASSPVALCGILALVISGLVPASALATKYAGAFMENGGGARALGMGGAKFGGGSRFGKFGKGGGGKNKCFTCGKTGHWSQQVCEWILNSPSVSSM